MEGHHQRSTSLTQIASVTQLLPAFLVQHGMSAIPQGAKGTGVNPNAVAPSTADDVRMIISLLLTPGLDPNIDRICVDLLKSSNHSAGIGMSS